MIDAAEGRATGLHYGTFDYSACLGVSAAYQASDHPAADHAKAIMQVAAAGTGVRVSDGSTNVLPVGPTEQVHEAWRLHYGLTRRALARAYYQGWDMHPGHLPDPLRGRLRLLPRGLRAGRRPARRATPTKAGGDVMDEPATAKALSGYLLRGLDCGALDTAEVAAADRPDPRRPGGLRGAAPGRPDGHRSVGPLSRPRAPAAVRPVRPGCAGPRRARSAGRRAPAPPPPGRC